MNVNCPKCNFNYEIDDSKIPSSGAKVKCSNCSNIFEIKPSSAYSMLIIKTTDNSEYEVSSIDEVKEWIEENRVLRNYEITKDGHNWQKLNDIPELKEIFDRVSQKLKVPDVLEEPTTENFKNLSMKQSIKKFDDNKIVMNASQKMGYEEYDDSVIKKFPTQSSKGKIFFIIIIVILLIGGGIFFLNKDGILKILNKVQTTNPQIDDIFNEGVLYLEKYDEVNIDKSIELFDKILKENSKHTFSYAYKSIGNSIKLMFFKYEVEFLKSLKEKLVKIEKEKNDFKFVTNSSETEKKIIQYENKMKDILLQIELNSKLAIENSADNYQAIISRAFYFYFTENKTEFQVFYNKAKNIKGKENNEFNGFLDILLYILNGENPIDGLKIVSKDFKSFIPFKYILGFYNLKEEKYEVALATFETVTALNTTHDLANDLIEITEAILKQKDLFIVIKEETKTDENKITDVKTDETKKDETKTEEVKTDEIKVEEVKKDPFEGMSQEQIINAGDKFFDSQKNTAINYYKKALTKGPSAKASAQLGWIFYDKGNYKNAISFFMQAIATDASYADAYVGVGQAYYDNEQFDEAKKYLEIFLQKAPSSPDANIAKNLLKEINKK